MPTLSPMRLTLALTALLAAGTTPAEARRAAESFPAPMRFLAPSLANQIQKTDNRAPSERARLDGRGDARENSRSERRDDHHMRGSHGGHEFEDAEEHESHHFGHHHHDDSPGC